MQLSLPLPLLFASSLLLSSSSFLVRFGATAQVNSGNETELIGDDTDDESVLFDIPTTAINAGIFDTLVAALSATDLVGAISSPNGPFTVFAPTDDAFAALPDGLVTCLLEEDNLPVLSNILLYHVASGKALSTDLSNEMSVPTLLEGQNVIIDLSNGDGVKINDSTVSTPDVLASNGVIHIIDQVLVPSNVDVAAFLDTCNNGGSSDNKNDSSSLVDRFPNDIVQIGSDYSINVDRVDIDDDKGVENDADADADACKSIHDVLTDVGANEFSNLLKKRKIDFKYGEFTVFAYVFCCLTRSDPSIVLESIVILETFY